MLYKRYKLPGIALLLLASALPIWGDSFQFKIRSGHQSRINTVEIHPEKPYLFSADNTGVVCVWNYESGRMIHNFQASRYNITRIAVNPEQPQIALYETNNQNYQRITLWDWQREEKSHSLGLREEPLFFDYSSGGTYFYQGFSSSPTLRFYRADQGSRTPYMQDVLDIASYGYVGSSEKYLMTYSIAGSFTYRDIRRNTVVRQVDTTEGLRNLMVTADKRHVLARRESSLLLIDRLTGREKQRIEVDNMEGFSYHPGSGRLSVWGMENQKVYLRSWLYRPSTETQEALIDLTTESRYRTPLDSVAQAVQTEKTVFLAGLQGNIYSWEPGTAPVRINSADDAEEEEVDNGDRSPIPPGDWDSFSLNRLEDVYGTALEDDLLFVSTGQGIFRFQSPYFDQDRDISNVSLLSSMEYSILEQPLDSPGAIRALSGDQLLLWCPEDRDTQAMAVIDAESGETKASISIDGVIRDLKYNRDTGQILYLTRSGSIGIYDLNRMMLVFSYTVRGARAVAFIDDQTIAVGSPSTRRNPLMKINLDTRENSSLSDSCFVVYSLAMDRKNQKLYYIGLEKRGDAIVTLMKRRTGNNLERTRSLLRHGAEDYTAEVVMDPDSRRLFTNLGQDRIRLWTGSRFKNFDQARRYPISLIPLDRLIVSIDEDQSVHFWDSVKGESLNKLYIFKSGGWAFLPNDSNRFYGTPESGDHVTVERNGRRLSGRSSSRLYIHARP